jgi:N-acetylglucosaminyl-diphospho-decaprenol L-rhamnosyltransferase
MLMATMTEGNGTVVDLSVVVINHNSGPMLRECLRSLRINGGPLALETIVVDNGSRDSSLSTLPAELWPSQLVRLEENIGFGRANNIGLTRARGRHYLLLNTDCFVTPDLCTTLVRCLDARPAAAVAGPRLCNWDGTLQPSCHNFPTPLILFAEQSLLWKALRHLPILRERLLIAGDHARPRQVDWLSGACLLVRATAFAQVGGFDETFFFYWEETDLCLRLRQQGWEARFEPTIRAVHIGGGSSVSPILRRQFFQSLARFYAKHYSPHQRHLAWTILFVMVLFKAVRAAIVALRPDRSAREREAAKQEAASWLAAVRP